MFIAIDVGNTNVHLGVWEAGRWAHHWRARTVADKMPDEYAVLVRNFFEGVGISWRMVTGVAISSVVPPLTLAFVELVRRYGKIEPLVVTAQTPTGIQIAIDQPEQAGADRIVNSAAAVALYGSPAIVIDFGTATTFDVVSGDGAYRGGAIAPGLNLAHDALVSRAARLHKIDLQPPPSPIGSNTIHAMQSGIFLGYVALVEGLVGRIKGAMDADAVPVIATGGLAPLFDQHTDVIDHIAPALTLDGLRIIYALNQPK
ncbi:MAG: type III pantothenate kinase [Anaerolineaceae bacterium]|nr:MAG: type III pantothenate kinase [Anaerolineaceae bacterium]